MHQTTSETPTAHAAEEAFPSPQHLKWAMIILMGYFGLRLLYLAWSISPFVPPDEATHLGIATIFSQAPLLPDNSPESYQYGLVTNIPWLYYWVMGKLLLVNFFGMPDLVFLRLCNIPIAFALIYYVWRMLRLLTEDRLAQILVVAAATNTMMLTFISASVSYDNLVNLMAVMATYYLLAFFRERSPLLLVASFVCQLAGCLTKLTMLPLVPVLGVILLLHEFRNLPRLPSALVSFLRALRPLGIVLTAALLVFLALNVQLYLGNYLRYHALNPDMTQVLPLEDALQNRMVARGYVFNQYKEGKVSKEKALQMTELVKHPGDRADAVYMINNYAETKRPNAPPPLSFAQYTPLWVSRMAAGVFGIFAHLMMPAGWPQIAPFAFLGAFALAAFAVRWRPRDAGWSASYLVAVILFYTWFIMYKINYQGYLDSRAPYVALQGRYIFPVIGPIYALAGCYLMRLFKAHAARLALCGIAVAIFIGCDFPVFLARVTPQWTYWP